MRNLLQKLEQDFPQLDFIQDDSFYWSPAKKTVFYANKDLDKTDAWSLLHEVAHGVLGHSDYNSDFELLKLESEAWGYADKLGAKYDIQISQEHIQECLDTYRDWLYGRSTCPRCKIVASQQNLKTYRCFNCKSTWQVSNSRFCRPYRMTKAAKSD